MELNDIYKVMDDFPTIIDFDNEILSIKRIMEVTDTDLLKNRDILIQMLEMLEFSHFDNGIFLVDNQNYSFFVSFYNWLIDKNDKLNLRLPIELIDTFLAKWDDDEITES